MDLASHAGPDYSCSDSGGTCESSPKLLERIETARLDGKIGLVYIGDCPWWHRERNGPGELERIVEPRDWTLRAA